MALFPAPEIRLDYEQRYFSLQAQSPFHAKRVLSVVMKKAPSAQSLIKLRAALHDIVPIDDAVWVGFEPLLFRREISRSENVVSQGEVSRLVSFIVSGCFRFYSLTERGDEAVNGFALEGDLVASMNSLVEGIPSYFSIEALENADVLQFDWNQVRDSDYFNRLRETVSQDLFKGLERRQQEFLTDTPEQRYLSFLNRSAQINSRVADRHIASYLGITPVHLSRIRRKLRKEAAS